MGGIWRVQYQSFLNECKVIFSLYLLLFWHFPVKCSSQFKCAWRRWSAGKNNNWVSVILFVFFDWYSLTEEEVSTLTSSVGFKLVPPPPPPPFFVLFLCVCVCCSSSLAVQFPKNTVMVKSLTDAVMVISRRSRSSGEHWSHWCHFQRENRSHAFYTNKTGAISTSFVRLDFLAWGK